VIVRKNQHLAEEKKGKNRNVRLSHQEGEKEKEKRRAEETQQQKKDNQKVLPAVKKGEEKGKGPIFANPI